MHSNDKDVSDQTHKAAYVPFTGGPSAVPGNTHALWRAFLDSKKPSNNIKRHTEDDFPPFTASTGATQLTITYHPSKTTRRTRSPHRLSQSAARSPNQATAPHVEVDVTIAVLVRVIRIQDRNSKSRASRAV
jgi:hypothetical protein